eukprot:185886-Pelagomonas_calceolata.AAC.1
MMWLTQAHAKQCRCSQVLCTVCAMTWLTQVHAAQCRCSQVLCAVCAMMCMPHTQVHAAVEMSPGDELLRSYLGASITQPLPQREAELAEAGWPGLEASTARGALESQVSDNVREVLQDRKERAWSFLDEALQVRAVA